MTRNATDPSAGIAPDAPLHAALAQCGRAPVVDSDLAARWWRPLPGLPRLRLPNFAWRRAALARHDAHHVLTGYPFTPAGEMQVAAWEFAAGRYPHAGATAFCLPLVGLGALCLPHRTFAAFVRGRRSRTLYARDWSTALLNARVDDLRATFVAPPAPASPRDRLAFLGLVVLSLGWLALPCALSVLAFRFAVGAP